LEHAHDGKHDRLGMNHHIGEYKENTTDDEGEILHHQLVVFYYQPIVGIEIDIEVLEVVGEVVNIVIDFLEEVFVVFFLCIKIIIGTCVTLFPVIDREGEFIITSSPFGAGMLRGVGVIEKDLVSVIVGRNCFLFHNFCHLCIIRGIIKPTGESDGALAFSVTIRATTTRDALQLAQLLVLIVVLDHCLHLFDLLHVFVRHY